MSPGDEGVWVDTLSDVMRKFGVNSALPPRDFDIVRFMILGHSAEVTPLADVSSAA